MESTTSSGAVNFPPHNFPEVIYRATQKRCHQSEHQRQRQRQPRAGRRATKRATTIRVQPGVHTAARRSALECHREGQIPRGGAQLDISEEGDAVRDLLETAREAYERKKTASRLAAAKRRTAKKAGAAAVLESARAALEAAPAAALEAAPAVESLAPTPDTEPTPLPA